MKNQEYKTTKEIESQYRISRQTIHNWIQKGFIRQPRKGKRNGYIWNYEDEKQLVNMILQKKNKHSGKCYINKLKISNRRYLGSKQKLLDFIKQVVDNHTENIETVADIFAGTGVVADMFSSNGKKVIVNDILYSNYISYHTWFGNEKVNIELIKNMIDELNKLSPKEDNYISINFGDKYFSMENAKKIGAIREKIDTYKITFREKCFLLTSLLYAMDKVANTVGHYDAYRKKMDSNQRIFLKMPEVKQNKKNEIYREDANDLVRKISADLVYIDTPYNSRQYGDAYHLLENVIEWRKPALTGIAMKMVDRENIKSKYSTKKAPEAFDDLIENIKARYILVSYNNMAQKGNGRSNAKISQEDILNSLKKRGKVEIFDMPFKVFTTGKTNIDNHKELLYLCEIDHPKKVKPSNHTYVKSAINYTGGKYKLLPQILPLFPKHINNFFDVFAGGANVAVNVKAQGQIIINDINTHVIDLYEYIKNHQYEDIMNNIFTIIRNYNLSNTFTYGYEYYGVTSSEGLKDVNKNQYEKLRADYNSGLFPKNIRPLIFYILIIFSFNNQIRFNKDGFYNMPTGKRDFNKNMQEKLLYFKKALDSQNILLKNSDFTTIIDSIENPEDFVYIDPPYLISLASYNESNGWNIEKEHELLSKLNELNKKGIRFALSNVLLHKGEENFILKKWIHENNYQVNYLEFNYNNSNYQSKARNCKTIEIIVTNY